MAKTKKNEPEFLTMQKAIDRVNDLQGKYLSLDRRCREAISTIVSDKPERERLTAEFATAITTGDAKALDKISKEAKALFPARQKVVEVVDELESDFEKVQAEERALVGEAGTLFDARTLQHRRTLGEIGPGIELNHRQALLDEASSIMSKCTSFDAFKNNLEKRLEQLRNSLETHAEAAQEAKEPEHIAPVPFESY